MHLSSVNKRGDSNLIPQNASLQLSPGRITSFIASAARVERLPITNARNRNGIIIIHKRKQLLRGNQNFTNNRTM